jgi:CspA family cold shock protein
MTERRQWALRTATEPRSRPHRKGGSRGVGPVRATIRVARPGRLQHPCYSWAITDVVMLPCGRPLLELTVRLQLSFEKTLEVNVTTGTIKKVVSERGFGFISGEDGKEYFFHRDGLTSSLNFDRLSGGEKVEFEIEQSPKGARAKNVTAA